MNKNYLKLKVSIYQWVKTQTFRENDPVELFIPFVQTDLAWNKNGKIPNKYISFKVLFLEQLGSQQNGEDGNILMITMDIWKTNMWTNTTMSSQLWFPHMSRSNLLGLISIKFWAHKIVLVSVHEKYWSHYVGFLRI